MGEELTYDELAAHYDRIYHDKPYEQEARRVLDRLEALGASPGDRLLDVGCGTGNHVQHFVEAFEVTGVDVSEAMLDVARDRVPEARLVQGDVTSLELGETFDAATCLFGVIGYVETWAKLDRAVSNLAAHLEPGAPFVVESWIPPERFEAIEGEPTVRTYEGEDVTLARIGVPRAGKDETARLDIEWLIARPGREIQRYSETQHMGVFGVERTLDLFDEHGLDARFEEDGLTELRGLFVGTRRT